MVSEPSDFYLLTQKDFSEQRMNNEQLQSGSTQPTTRLVNNRVSQTSFSFLTQSMIELKC